jgi:predicted RNA-binding protein YlqC (UPF0109 family)
MSSTDPMQDPERVVVDDDEFDETQVATGEGLESVDEVGDEAAAMDTTEDAEAESLRGLILYLATNLVDDPEAVDVSASRRGSVVDLRLTVPEEELGRIIGRQGRIARALRTSLMVAGSRHHLRVSLDIEPT